MSGSGPWPGERIYVEVAEPFDFTTQDGTNLVEGTMSESLGPHGGPLAVVEPFSFEGSNVRHVELVDRSLDLGVLDSWRRGDAIVWGHLILLRGDGAQQESPTLWTLGSFDRRLKLSDGEAGPAATLASVSQVLRGENSRRFREEPISIWLSSPKSVRVLTGGRPIAGIVLERPGPRGGIVCEISSTCIESRQVRFVELLPCRMGQDIDREWRQNAGYIVGNLVLHEHCDLSAPLMGSSLASGSFRRAGCPTPIPSAR